jgi:hypothetical protein
MRIDTGDGRLDTALVDRDDTERIERLRSTTQIHLAHLEELREMDDADVSATQWDRAERAYFDTLNELDGELERLGLERREDLGVADWHQPLSDHARPREWDLPEWGDGIKEWGRDPDEGYGIGY